MQGVNKVVPEQQEGGCPCLTLGAGKETCVQYLRHILNGILLGSGSCHCAVQSLAVADP